MLDTIFQVIALCQAPFLLDDPNVGLIFPADAIARAKQFLAMTSGGLGILFIDKLLIVTYAPPYAMFLFLLASFSALG